MMNLSVLTRAQADYIAFRLRENDVREVFATRRDDWRHGFADECVAAGGFCLSDGAGVPYAMLGVWESWRGVGNAWMVGTDDVAKHGKTVTRAARQVLAQYGHLHRIQAYSAAFYTASHGWLKRLGFERAALLRGFGRGGEDFYLFEILGENHVSGNRSDT